MNELEIALGSLYASHSCICEATKLNEIEQQYCVEGSRALICANANAKILKEVQDDIGIAIRKLDEALQRYNRMVVYANQS